MRTDELIQVLARQAGPAPRALAARRLGMALAGGMVLALAAALLAIGPVPAALFAEPGAWFKLAYGLALVAAAGVWTLRLGQPGAPARAPARVAAGVVGLVLGIGLLSLLANPAGERLAALLGHSWMRCPLFVFGLSLPTLAGGLWALRGLAPTQPRRAGLAAGVLAGAVGAVAYAFACDELAPSFVAVWYSAGIVLAGALGAWLGPRWLRW
jgi:hypothetical protein